MTRQYETDDEEDWDDDESDDDDSDVLVECPYCREEIPEDVQRCPYCNEYISMEDSPPSRKSWWIVVTVFVCLAMMFLWLIGH